MTRSVRPARPHPLDEETSPAANHLFLYALLGIVLIAFGGFVWNVYSGREPARITAPPLAYKVEPSQTMTTQIPDAAPDESAVSESAASQPVLGASADERAASADVADAGNDGVEAVADAAATPAPPQRGAARLSASPRFTGNGAFVAQLAALQSAEAVNPAWARLSSRAPDLFASAHLDVERADLGQRGVYYRLRAGYFADRTQAGLFCDRIRNMGQDCIVVAR